jgi:hypothetical protein
MPWSIQSEGGLELANAGLTKSQRRRENERLQREAEQLFEEIMGSPSAAVVDFLNTVEPNILPGPAGQQQAWERAPAHTVIHDESPGLNTRVLANMSDLASESRTAESKLRISELRLKYPADWGQRGRAKKIAMLETEQGNPLSERTVQNYFKMTRN